MEVDLLAVVLERVQHRADRQAVLFGARLEVVGDTVLLIVDGGDGGVLNILNLLVHKRLALIDGLLYLLLKLRQIDVNLS